MKTVPELKKEIIAALKQYHVLNSSKININVIANVAWLSGKVDCYYKKYLIKEAVKNIAGVKHFRIDVSVDLSKQNQFSDEEIKHAILNKVAAKIPDSKIAVKVIERIVILTGTVVSDDERNIVLKAIFHVPGILNVWNFIELQPRNVFIKIQPKYNPVKKEFLLY